MPDRGALLLGVDVGTTHCKAALFTEDGVVAKISSRPTITHRAAEGWAYLDPQELWETVAIVAVEAASAAGDRPIAALGISSMAETGLLVDRSSGQPRSPLIPWFDTSAAPQAESLRSQSDPLERFSRAGIRPTFKSSLAKVLWLRGRQAGITRGGAWLSSADYIAFRLTGQMGTDYSLACRTSAFRLDTRTWDEDWLDALELPADLFPPARPSGSVLAAVDIDLPGLARGIPVAITGHDHVCGAFAAGAVRPGDVFNSMGTAESFLGVLGERPLGEVEASSGFTYGCHAMPGMFYWMGGISASGGSVEWLRTILGDPSLSYAALEALLSEDGQTPTGILYYPYLAGSGSPHSDPAVRAAFIGLSAKHGRSQLARAVLEGNAYELEYIRRAAEGVTRLPIDHLRVSGGGTRNPTWMQIKANVSGCRLDLLSMPETTLLGAALLAGVGAGFYKDHDQALARLQTQGVETVYPDDARHAAYQALYERGYLAFQAPLRAFGQFENL